MFMFNVHYSGVKQIIVLIVRGQTDGRSSGWGSRHVTTIDSQPKIGEVSIKSPRTMMTTELLFLNILD